MVFGKISFSDKPMSLGIRWGKGNHTFWNSRSATNLSYQCIPLHTNLGFPGFKMFEILTHPQQVEENYPFCECRSLTGLQCVAGNPLACVSCCCDLVPRGIAWMCQCWWKMTNVMGFILDGLLEIDTIERYGAKWLMPNTCQNMDCKMLSCPPKIQKDLAEPQTLWK